MTRGLDGINGDTGIPRRRRSGFPQPERRDPGERSERAEPLPAESELIFHPGRKIPPLRHRFPVMRRLLPIGATALALLLPPAAIGAATPVSPAGGAVVDTSHPVFTWSVPANEETDGIYVSRAPDTTVEGEFFSENVVDSDVFFANETSWSPRSALPAGTYWWNVWSHDRESFTSFYSAPVSFEIPARVRIASIRIRRYTGLDALDVTVRFVANTGQARVAVRLRRGSRTVWSKAELDEFVSIGEVSSVSLTWFGHGRIREGSRLRLSVRVEAGGAQASATRPVRAP